MNTFTPHDHDHPPTSGHIRTISGRYVNLLAPLPDMIHPDDIAHGLAHLCRFGGHVPTFYSVAEHSLHVAAMVHRQFGDHWLTLCALLHDATEAYLGDMVRPLKQQMPGYKDAEAAMAKVIGERFGLSPGWDEVAEVKAADEAALVWEMATVRDAWWRTSTPPTQVADAFGSRLWGLLNIVNGAE